MMSGSQKENEGNNVDDIKTSSIPRGDNSTNVWEGESGKKIKQERLDDSNMMLNHRFLECENTKEIIDVDIDETDDVDIDEADGDMFIVTPLKKDQDSNIYDCQIITASFVEQISENFYTLQLNDSYGLLNRLSHVKVKKSRVFSSKIEAENEISKKMEMLKYTSLDKYPDKSELIDEEVDNCIDGKLNLFHFGHRKVNISDLKVLNKQYDMFLANQDIYIVEHNNFKETCLATYSIY